MTTPNQTHYIGDDLIIKCLVAFASGAPFTNLTGAVITILASNGGAPLPAASVTVAGNEITGTYGPGAFTVATWNFQIRATKAGKTKTLAAFAIDMLASL